MPSPSASKAFEAWWARQMEQPLVPFNPHSMCREAWHAALTQAEAVVTTVELHGPGCEERLCTCLAMAERISQALAQGGRGGT